MEPRPRRGGLRAPTLIQEAGGRAPVEEKRAELAATPAESCSADEEVAEIRAIGDNTRLHGAQGRRARPRGRGAPDRWALSPELGAVGSRWGIEPERDLRPA